MNFNISLEMIHDIMINNIKNNIIDIENNNNKIIKKRRRYGEINRPYIINKLFKKTKYEKYYDKLNNIQQVINKNKNSNEFKSKLIDSISNEYQ